MKKIIKFFDFWLGDFSWYRNFTLRKGDVWYKLGQDNTSFWVREDIHFELKLKVVEIMERDYPNLDLSNEEEVKKVAQDIVYQFYGNEVG